MSDVNASTVKYAEVVMSWLQNLGYTHCFFVAGGNIMHLLDGARKTMTCIPTVHEVAAGIAVEYFNESNSESKAFALVTAGPGLTNIVTAIGGAWLESRELLVLGGQAKSTDLAGPTIRQRGIQEIKGSSIVEPICVLSECIDTPWDQEKFYDAVLSGSRNRSGPVFLEFCLDTQGTPIAPEELENKSLNTTSEPNEQLCKNVIEQKEKILELMAKAERPVWLIGARVTRKKAKELQEVLLNLEIPLMTTWNGADRLSSEATNYFGRPNNWGQRHSNILLAQADLIVTFGARLGLQQTGFNWQEFAPSGKVVQIDVDLNEIEKGHPEIYLGIAGDPDTALEELTKLDYPSYGNWMTYCHSVSSELPSPEPINETNEGFISPYEFCLELSKISNDDDIFVVASSGGANSVPMQTLRQRDQQTIITDNGLASMGYGLSGGIGTAFAHPSRRTLMIEGDGGFAQNLQELATVSVNNLDLKIFLFCNEGYGSIRMTQKNYFDGAYLGCDTETGLGFPDWNKLFEAYNLPSMTLTEKWSTDQSFLEAFSNEGPYGFIVPVDPLQTYWPKISSRITKDGGMESNPLHFMTPELSEELSGKVLKYL